MVEKAIIVGPMLLQVEAQVEKGLVDQSSGPQDKRNQKAADASVSVEERVDTFQRDVARAALTSTGSCPRYSFRKSSSSPMDSREMSGGGGT